MPFLTTLFPGAFNNNVYKNPLIAFTAVRYEGVDDALPIDLCAGLSILLQHPNNAKLSGGCAFLKLPRRLFARIRIIAAKPIAPDRTELDALYAASGCSLALHKMVAQNGRIKMQEVYSARS